MKHVLFQLRAKDIVVLLGSLIRKEAGGSLTELAKSLFMSHSEVHQSLKRAQISNLYDPMTKRPKRAALEELIIHGLPYIFPASPGQVVKGVPTAHSASPLSHSIVSHDQDVYVWPYEEGIVRGKSITPLTSSAPQIALSSPSMHEILALVDALRVGKSREKNHAKDELSKRIRKI